jgi:hypothetical protein
MFILLLLSILALPACVLPTRFSEPGPYIGGSLTGAMEYFDNDISDEDATTGGFALKGGYRFLPWLAAELDYEYLDEFDTKINKIDMQTLTVQGKFNPLAGRFQPYGMVGLGYGWADARYGGSDSDYLWRGGLGIDIYLIQMLAVFGEIAYTAPQGDLEDLPYATANIGVLFKF